MLLIGIGGSGRQSLSKLASFICMYTVFQIEVSKNYKRAEFREGLVNFIIIFLIFQLINLYWKLDLKKLYSQAGISNKETTFILVDTQVVDETFFEDINNILSSGEVPNLYKTEELEEVLNE
jgi:dynein heavy chain, axonemal